MNSYHESYVHLYGTLAKLAYNVIVIWTQTRLLIPGDVGEADYVMLVPSVGVCIELFRKNGIMVTKRYLRTSICFILWTSALAERWKVKTESSSE